VCVLFIDFAPVRITAKLCNYAAFAQKKAKLSRVEAAPSKIVVDFLAGLQTISRQIQFYTVCQKNPVDDYFKVPLATSDIFIN